MQVGLGNPESEMNERARSPKRETKSAERNTEMVRRKARIFLETA